MNFASKLEMSAEDDPVLLKIGSISVSNYSLAMGIISALIAVPVNILIVIIFSKRRIRMKETDEKSTKSENKTEIKQVLVSNDEEDEEASRKRFFT